MARSAKSCTGLDLLTVWITLTAAVNQTCLPLHLGIQKGFTQSSWSSSDHNYSQPCHFQAAEISYLTKKLNMLQLTGKLVCPVFLQQCIYIVHQQKIWQDLFSNLDSILQSWHCKPWGEESTYITFLTHMMPLTTHHTILIAFLKKVRLYYILIKCTVSYIPSISNPISPENDKTYYNHHQNMKEARRPKQEATWFSKTPTED